MYYSTSIIAYLFAVFLLVFMGPHITRAATTTIDATVKIGICGNGMVEGSEECEGTLPTSPSCIKCDIACSFDRTDCTGIVPTLTPLTAVATNPAGSTIAPTTASTLPPRIVEDKLASIPPSVARFDPNGDGVITSDEIETAMRRWIEVWKAQGNNGACDLNTDASCNIVDISVLLFYINQ